MNSDTTQLLAIAAALGWASGLRLYAVLFLTGLAGYLGLGRAAAGLQLLQRPAGARRQRADAVRSSSSPTRFPGVDTLWDMVHTLVRIPAGAALAGGGVRRRPVELGDRRRRCCGGTLAATAMSPRRRRAPRVNTSPEPFSNIGLSLLGDAAVPASALARRARIRCGRSLRSRWRRWR